MTLHIGYKSPFRTNPFPTNLSGNGLFLFYMVFKKRSGLQKSVDLALSARTADKTVGRVKNYPGFDGEKDIDYDRLEKIQMRAAEKMAKRPIYLGTKRIDEPLPKGAVPAL